jgi:phosphate transport system permease protein
VDPFREGAEDHRAELGAAEVVAGAAQPARRPALESVTEVLSRPWSDKRTERLLGALACSVLVLIAGMVIFVFVKAWPSFAHNGLSWFGSGGNVDQQLDDIFNSTKNGGGFDYTIRAWPLLWGTAVTTVGAVVLGLALSLFAAIFIVEFAPERVRSVLDPVVRLLAAVPSVVYGLIGVLVIVPFVGNHLISAGRKDSVAYVVQLTGASLGVAILILTVMITPIMLAIIVDALRSVPRSWTEGAAALGVNRWRVMWTISVRAVRPAIIAAAVLATARALGEAIMLSMVSGSVGFAPNPIDGLTFFFEPTRPLAATIVDRADGLSVTPFGQTLYAFAAVLLVSALFLSFAGWAAKQPLKKYGLTS